MAYEHPGAGALDYFPCRYGTSKLVFRGPRRPLGGDYAVALGGTETYGKFIAEPWPDLLEQEAGCRVINLGCVNAGVDAYLRDPGLLTIAVQARLRFVQITGAQNLSNRYYAVHPRRNDRFLRATAALRRIYPEVDFTEFSFTRHLMAGLLRRCPDRFEQVAAELRRMWRHRMEALFESLGAPVVLVWIGQAPPPKQGQMARIGPDPLLIDAAMLEALRPRCAGIVQVLDPQAGSGTEGMHFAPLETTAATGLPGPEAHARVAQALLPFIPRCT